MGGPGLEVRPRTRPQGVSPIDGGYEIILQGHWKGEFEDDKLRVAMQIKDLMAGLTTRPSTSIQQVRGESEEAFRLRSMEEKLFPRTSYLLEFLIQVHTLGG